MPSDKTDPSLPKALPVASEETAKPDEVAQDEAMATNSEAETTEKTPEKTPEKVSDPDRNGSGKAGPNKNGPNKQAGGKGAPNKQGGGKPGPNRPGQGGPGGKKTPPPPRPINVLPMAGPATVKRRHWGIFFSFFVMVLSPLAAAIFYLWFVAVDQYGSAAGFTVRSEEAGGASDLLGGLAAFTGSGGTSDGNVLFEFVQSQEIVERIHAEHDLVAIYSKAWPDDPLFALWPDATIEEILWYWKRVVRIAFDQSTGLVDLEVLAFDPDDAQRIAQAVVQESQDMINALNTQARDDAMGYAQADLVDALERLKIAREALIRFRTRTQIVDPTADLQGQMGVVNNLQQQLAEALIELDLLADAASSNDPRIVQAELRIVAIRDRIAEERRNFASETIGGVDADYPTLMAEYESLIVDREFAEESYRAALTALDVARANASRQSRYLATYVNPTRAQSSEYPQRYLIAGLVGLFMLLFWGILALVYYSIRDRQ